MFVRSQQSQDHAAIRVFVKDKYLSKRSIPLKALTQIFRQLSAAS